MQRVRLELTTTRVSDGHSDQLNYLCVKVKAHSTTDLRSFQTLHILYLFRIVRGVHRSCLAFALLSRGLRLPEDFLAVSCRTGSRWSPRPISETQFTTGQVFYHFRELKYLIDACWHLRNY